jgi:undecaprenyl diphosphate synthase
MDTPRHVAIIMDGNGRWAQARRRPRTYGHLAGARVAKRIITCAAEMGLQNLTLFAFSTENWARPETEVRFLMRLLGHQILREQKNLMKNNIRFRTIGELTRLPDSVRKIVEDTEALTQNNTGLNLVFALSYGGRQEILTAAKEIALRAARGELDVNQLDENSFGSHLQSSFLPDPDLILRTSGEERLSNFFLWQAAYAEIMVLQKFWPEFTTSDFQSAIATFSLRERRYGQVGTLHQPPAPLSPA